MKTALRDPNSSKSRTGSLAPALSHTHTSAPLPCCSVAKRTEGGRLAREREGEGTDGRRRKRWHGLVVGVQQTIPLGKLDRSVIGGAKVPTFGSRISARKRAVLGAAAAKRFISVPSSVNSACPFKNQSGCPGGLYWHRTLFSRYLSNLDPGMALSKQHSSWYNNS